MRILLLGAAGKLGRRLASALLSTGEHSMTLFVRDEARLALAVPAELLDRVKVGPSPFQTALLQLSHNKVPNIDLERTARERSLSL